MLLWFDIRTPDGTHNDFQVYSRTTGEELLHLICSRLGIGEKDGRLFGLTRRRSHCNSLLWLDASDAPFVHQLPRKRPRQPWELQLRLKYFVRAQEMETIQTKKYACCEVCCRLSHRWIPLHKTAQLSYILYNIRSLLEWDVLYELEKYWRLESRKELPDMDLQKALLETKTELTGASASQHIDFFLRQADALECCTAYKFVGTGETGTRMAILVGRQSITMSVVAESGQYQKVAEIPYEEINFSHFYPNAGSRRIRITNKGKFPSVQLEARCHHRAYSFCQVVHDQCKFFKGPETGPVLPQCSTTSYKLRSWFKRNFKKRCATRNRVRTSRTADSNDGDSDTRPEFVSTSCTEESSDSSSSSDECQTSNSNTSNSNTSNSHTSIAAMFEATAAQLRQLQQCQSCHTEQVQVAFYPCGHALYCKSCALKEADCSVCMVKIKSRLQIYWA